MPGLFFIRLIAITGLAALVLQIGLTLARAGSLPAGLAEFLGYFTNYANALVTVVAVRAGWRGAAPVSQTGAAAVAILVTMVIYHLILAPQWDPEGLVLVSTTLLHTVIPLGYLLWWLVYAPKAGLGFGDPPKWLALPAAYLVLALLRGWATGFWPYSFLDVAAIGWPATLRNAALIAMVFLGSGVLLVALSRVWRRGRSPA
jgi:hypothetical protein